MEGSFRGTPKGRVYTPINLEVFFLDILATARRLNNLYGLETLYVQSQNRYIHMIVTFWPICDVVATKVQPNSDFEMTSQIRRVPTGYCCRPYDLGNYWNFYQMSSNIGRHKIKKQFNITHLVCKLWISKVQKRQNRLFSGNAKSGYANLTKFCRIINIDIKNQHWKFQTDILKIVYFA